MFNNPNIKRSLACLLVSLTAACSGGDTETVSNNELFVTGPDRSDAFFEAAKVVTVDIQMDPAEYDILRNEGRQMADLFTGCPENFDYTHFESTVSVDGERFERVDIRKKGFLGSLSANRPSFKLNFGTHVPGRVVQSVQRITLQNNRQDASDTHQCISYGLFRKAGLNAPRCNFAKVSVNGQDLGYYSNIDSVKEPFLRRNFDNAGGNLYEGQLGAFSDNRKQGFQLKTNRQINDRSDLDAVISALSADDANFPMLIEQVVDIDQFIDFWAMEIVTSHWDGASSNANNYYIYNNPDDGRFSFIPWGTDGALSPGGATGGSFPIWHHSFLSDRLINTPHYRERLFARVEELLNTVYDVDSIHTEMDRIQQLTNAPLEAVQATKDFVAGMPALLREAMAGEIPDDTEAIVDGVIDESRCAEPRGRITGQFSNGSGSFSFTNREGENIEAVGFVQNGNIGGGVLGNSNPQSKSFNILAFQGSKLFIAIFSIEEPDFVVGTVPTHGVATTVFLIDPTPGGFFGILADAEITFDTVSADGESFSGSFEGDVAFNTSLFGS